MACAPLGALSITTNRSNDTIDPLSLTPLTRYTSTGFRSLHALLRKSFCGEDCSGCINVSTDAGACPTRLSLPDFPAGQTGRRAKPVIRRGRGFRLGRCTSLAASRPRRKGFPRLEKYRSASRLQRTFLLRVPSSRTPYNHLQNAAPCSDSLVEQIAAAFKSKKRRHRGLVNSEAGGEQHRLAGTPLAELNGLDVAAATLVTRTTAFPSSARTKHGSCRNGKERAGSGSRGD